MKFDPQKLGYIFALCGTFKYDKEKLDILHVKSGKFTYDPKKLVDVLAKSGTFKYFFPTEDYQYLSVCLPRVVHLSIDETILLKVDSYSCNRTVCHILFACKSGTLKYDPAKCEYVLAKSSC